VSWNVWEVTGASRLQSVEVHVGAILAVAALKEIWPRTDDNEEEEEEEEERRERGRAEVH